MNSYKYLKLLFFLLLLVGTGLFCCSWKQKPVENYQQLLYINEDIYEQKSKIEDKYGIEIHISEEPGFKIKDYDFGLKIDDDLLVNYLDNLDWALGLINENIREELSDFYFVSESSINGLTVTINSNKTVIIFANCYDTEQIRYVLLHELFHSLTLKYDSEGNYDFINLKDNALQAFLEINDSCLIFGEYACANTKETMASAFAYYVVDKENNISRSNQFYEWVEKYASPILLK